MEKLTIEDRVDDLNLLLDILPSRLKEELKKHPKLQQLTEIIMDFGVVAEVRFTGSTQKLKELGEVSLEDIHSVVKKIGQFNGDNRAGIERTLHRISAIKNRAGKIIGLTCRVGRAVEGTISPIRDLIESGKSILFLGPPGSGKTTKLRETARVLADQLHKRVVVVDTSNEIAGDGDISHPGIGSARRMQVPSPDKQHAVMIEAVENHNPEIIIVDEIGTEEETKAARTIAERGVQLVATAHGMTLENLLKNPTLSDLLGGIQSVVLGDEEAKNRGSQKTVLERKSFPTFNLLIEVQQRDVFAIYKDVKICVDAYLRNYPVEPEIRHREESGEVIVITPEPGEAVNKLTRATENTHQQAASLVFPFAINTDTLKTVIKELSLPLSITSKVQDADFVLTTKAQSKSKLKLQEAMEGKELPVHVILRNGKAELDKFFRSYFQLNETENNLEDEAIKEITAVCNLVQAGKKAQEASAHPPSLRRIQHQYADRLGLNSMSVGKEPNRRVRVYPSQ